MPLVFRKIRQSRWIKEDLDFAWLGSGEIPGDPLGDLAPLKGDLSVFLINDGRSDPERVAAAMVTKQASLSNVDYVLAELGDLQNIGFEFEEAEGETADGLVNSWHRNIIELSGSKVLALASTLWISHLQIGRVSEKKVWKRIVEGVSTGEIDRSKLSSNIKKLINDLK